MIDQTDNESLLNDEQAEAAYQKAQSAGLSGEFKSAQVQEGPAARVAEPMTHAQMKQRFTAPVTKPTQSEVEHGDELVQDTTGYAATDTPPNGAPEPQATPTPPQVNDPQPAAIDPNNINFPYQPQTAPAVIPSIQVTPSPVTMYNQPVPSYVGATVVSSVPQVQSNVNANPPQLTNPYAQEPGDYLTSLGPITAFQQNVGRWQQESMRLMGGAFAGTMGWEEGTLARQMREHDMQNEFDKNHGINLDVNQLKDMYPNDHFSEPMAPKVAEARHNTNVRAKAWQDYVASGSENTGAGYNMAAGFGLGAATGILGGPVGVAVGGVVGAGFGAMGPGVIGMSDPAVVAATIATMGASKFVAPFIPVAKVAQVAATFVENLLASVAVSVEPWIQEANEGHVISGKEAALQQIQQAALMTVVHHGLQYGLNRLGGRSMTDEEKLNALKLAQSQDEQGGKLDASLLEDNKQIKLSGKSNRIQSNTSNVDANKRYSIKHWFVKQKKMYQMPGDEFDPGSISMTDDKGKANNSGYKVTTITADRPLRLKPLTLEEAEQLRYGDQIARDNAKDQAVREGYEGFSYPRNDGGNISNHVDVFNQQYEFKQLDPSQGVQGKEMFHGTTAELDNLSDARPSDTSDLNNLFGNGLYLTDKFRVAKSYAKGIGKVLSGRLADLKLLDLENQVPANVHKIFESLMPDNSKITLDPESLGKDMFFDFKEAHAGVTTEEEMKGVFKELTNKLQDAGYDGLYHIGGVYVGRSGKHNVAIVFDKPDVAPVGNRIEPITPHESNGIIEGTTGQIDAEKKVTPETIEQPDHAAIPEVKPEELAKAASEAAKPENSQLEDVDNDKKIKEMQKAKSAKDEPNDPARDALIKAEKANLEKARKNDPELDQLMKDEYDHLPADDAKLTNMYQKLVDCVMGGGFNG